MLTILFDGIAYGMLLFVIACGLAVTLGLMNFVNLAHGAAVDVLRAKVSDASIGCIHNRQPCRPSSASEADAACTAGDDGDESVELKIHEMW